MWTSETQSEIIALVTLRFTGQRHSSGENRWNMKHVIEVDAGKWKTRISDSSVAFFFLTCLTEDKDLTPHLHLALARDAFELKWLIHVEHDRKESVRWMLYSDTLTVSLSDLSTSYHLGNETGLKSQNILGIKPSLWNWNAIITVQKNNVCECVFIFVLFAREKQDFSQTIITTYSQMCNNQSENKASSQSSAAVFNDSAAHSN